MIETLQINRFAVLRAVLTGMSWAALARARTSQSQVLNTPTDRPMRPKSTRKSSSVVSASASNMISIQFRRGSHIFHSIAWVPNEDCATTTTSTQIAPIARLTQTHIFTSRTLLFARAHLNRFRVPRTNAVQIYINPVSGPINHWGASVSAVLHHALRYCKSDKSNLHRSHRKV